MSDYRCKIVCDVDKDKITQYAYEHPEIDNIFELYKQYNKNVQPIYKGVFIDENGDEINGENR